MLVRVDEDKIHNIHQILKEKVIFSELNTHFM